MASQKTGATERKGNSKPVFLVRKMLGRTLVVNVVLTMRALFIFRFK